MLRRSLRNSKSLQVQSSSIDNDNKTVAVKKIIKRKAKQIEEVEKKKEDEISQPNISQKVGIVVDKNNSIGGKRLSKDFYNLNAIDLSKALLGKVLARELPETGEILRGTIVETEAYPGDNDKASSTYEGRRTAKNEPLYMDPGTTFVYFTYGMYHCINISAKGDGSAVLIRALDPVVEVEFFHSQRNKSKKKKSNDDGSRDLINEKRFKIWELLNGPGKLCLGFDLRRDNCSKLDLPTSEVLWIEENQNPINNLVIESGKRIGIDSSPPEARDKLWRFFVKNNFSVSDAKPSKIRKIMEAELTTDSAEEV